VLHDDGAGHLRLLQQELANRGLKSDLDTRGTFPRLRIFAAAEIPDVAEFDNNVVAVSYGPDTWFSWPWAEPIARVAHVESAADEIFHALCDDQDDRQPAADD